MKTNCRRLYTALFSRSRVIALCLAASLGLFLASCGGKEASSAESAVERPTLLVYCGITMIKPMTELKGTIEARYPCTIVISKGGSGSLLKSLKLNKKGDLYFPGSDSYIKTAQAEGYVTETVPVGVNKAAIMVQKGNPKSITADLDNLFNREYYVVIGNPDSGSIGRETRKILTRKGIYDQVLSNARELTTDSKRLVQVLAEKRADLVINWYAAACWPENRDFVDVLPIHSDFAQPKRLVLGLLKFSRYPEIARAFMTLASSEEGQAVFRKYGLFDVQ